MSDASATAPLPFGGLPAAMREDTVSVGEKARTIFREMTSDRHATLEDWVRLLGRVGISLTEPTCRDMFEKIRHFGDREDPGLTESDIHRIVTVFPTLFSSVFCRITDQAADHRQREAIARETIDLENAAELASEIAERKRAADNEANLARRGLGEAARRVKEVEEWLAEKRGELQGVHGETRANRDAADAAARVLEQEDHEADAARRELGIPSAANDVEKAKISAIMADRDTELAALEVDRLERELAEMKAMLYQRRRTAFDAYESVNAAQARLADLELQIPNKPRLDAATRHACHRRDEVARSQQAEETLADDLRAIVAQLADTKRDRDALSDHLREVEDVLQQATRVHSESNAQLAARQERLDKMVEASESFDALRSRQYSEEMELIEQEIRLREQRECLEYKEALLRSETIKVIPATVRGSSPVRRNPAYGNYHHSLTPYQAADASPAYQPALHARPPSAISYPDRHQAGQVPRSGLSLAAQPSPAKPSPLPERNERFHLAYDHSGMEKTRTPARRQ
ncbi:hypothetical protein DIPPA_22148 [Diplonema papillatum]|nr:hypothetical protein DIPPA_22148 [Diplonema papillatum]